MDRFLRGDTAAFSRICGLLRPRLVSFLARRCGNRQDAEDLAQEALLRIHRARASFRPGELVAPWALRIARNVQLDDERRRATRRRTGAEVGLADEKATDRVAEPRGPADEHVIASELAARAQKSFARLMPLQREAFRLVRIEGLSIREAARELGATEMAVKLRAFRAYEALRLALCETKRGDARGVELHAR